MKILMADDHALFRDGMHYTLRVVADEVEIIEAATYPEMQAHLENDPGIDLILMDLNMPGCSGASSVKSIYQSYPNIPLVIISAYDQRSDIEAVMDSGAVGFIPKSLPAKIMQKALALVMDGGVFLPPQILLNSPVRITEEAGASKGLSAVEKYGLTTRQIQVLTHMACGLSNKQIALKMGLAEGTIKIHVAAAYQVLRVNSRIEAIRLAERLGLVSKL